MKNAVKGRSKTDLTYLYDELEGKLRALESLGRTQEKYGDFLIPLEVQGEEMVQLTRIGFGPQHNFRKNNASVEYAIQSELATASALVSLDSGKRPLCIFCDKKHPSEKCFAAKKMSSNDKQRILLKKRCQRFKDKAMSIKPAPLPLDRVVDCAAFEIVGIDFAGPLFLKSGKRSWRIDSSHTPAIFLGENHSYSVSDIEEVGSQKLSKRIKYRRKLFNDLRQRFRREYLSELIQKSNEKSSREPKVGEIVLIGDDNKKRLFWPMAKIIELITGRDGKIRTFKRKIQHVTVLRPVQRVYPLEIRANENCATEEVAGEGESNSKNGVNVTIAPNDVIKKYTSSGRCVKTPD
ncbi:DUF5641 domain-containing protein [Trichonephila clavipes]|nr:DUF5641 domain-containing protein [Trichonephila clavipes]